MRIKLKLAILLGLAVAQACSTAKAETSGGLEIIHNAEGGTILYGPLSIQCNLPTAFTTVLRSIHSRFGDKPEVGRLFQAKNTDSVAAFITAKPNMPGAKPITGLVIVMHPEGAFPAAALAYDDTDNFPKTINSMMKTLNDAWHPVSKSGSGTAASGSGQTRDEAPQPLNQTPFADNSGSIGLPQGWQITMARMGGVHAVGPKGEAVHLGVINGGIYDSNNAQAQRQMAYANRTGKPYLICPFNNDLVSAFKSVSQQINRMKRSPEPSINVLSAKPLDGSFDGMKEEMIAEMDFHDGKGPLIADIRLGTIRPGALGQWSLLVNSLIVPKEYAIQEWPTMAAIFGSWRQDSGVIGHATAVEIGKIHDVGIMVDNRVAATHAAEDEHNRQVYKQWDNQDKYSKSFQNYQLDQAVVTNTNTGAHRTLDMQSAATLVEANPDVYQYVLTPDFIKGKDY